MSDEQYTVILGDRRYAIHRKWARLPTGESFGFLSDLMVDAEGRVHAAQRGTDRPAFVRGRTGMRAIFDHCQIVFGGNRRYCVQITSVPCDVDRNDRLQGRALRFSSQRA